MRYRKSYKMPFFQKHTIFLLFCRLDVLVYQLIIEKIHFFRKKFADAKGKVAGSRVSGFKFLGFWVSPMSPNGWGIVGVVRLVFTRG